MEVAAVATAPDRRPLIALAIGYVVALALLPVELGDAYGGLPAHPLLLHVPVILIPCLVIATIALVARPAWRARFGVAWGTLAVVALIGTVLTVGAGEKFIERRPFVSSVLHDHKEAGETLRIVMFVFVALILLALARDAFGVGPAALGVGLAVLLVAGAATAGFYVVRTGHLGAKSAWGREGPGGGGGGGGFPPGGGGGRFGPPGATP